MSLSHKKNIFWGTGIHYKYDLGRKMKINKQLQQKTVKYFKAVVVLKCIYVMYLCAKEIYLVAFHASFIQ